MTDGVIITPIADAPIAALRVTIRDRMRYACRATTILCAERVHIIPEGRAATTRVAVFTLDTITARIRVLTREGIPSANGRIIPWASLIRIDGWLPGVRRLGRAEVNMIVFRIRPAALPLPEVSRARHALTRILPLNITRVGYAYRE